MKKVSGMSTLKNLNLLLMLLLGTSSFAKTKITKNAPASTTESLSEYKDCKTDALRKSRKYSNTKKRRDALGSMLVQCREEFPSIHMMNVCKANALRDYKNNATDFKLAMTECRTEYAKLKFHTKDLLPVTWHKDKIYFAGAGLNSPLKIRTKANNIGMTEKFGNFNCSNPVNAKTNKKLIEYILIGNTIDSWRPFAHSDRKILMKKLKLSKRNPKAISDILGELIYNKKSKQITNFLPSSFCYFDRKLAYSIDAIKTYYLLNFESNTATPYFGIAFYKDKKKPSVKKLEKLTKQRWPYNAVVTRKKNYTVISQYEIEDYDVEGDPKNLCSGARANSEIVLIGHFSSTKRADFIVVANIENLCSFGDNAAQRFLVSNSSKKN